MLNKLQQLGLRGVGTLANVGLGLTSGADDRSSPVAVPRTYLSTFFLFRGMLSTYSLLLLQSLCQFVLWSSCLYSKQVGG